MMSALDEALTLLAIECAASVKRECFDGYRDRIKLIKKAAAELTKLCAALDERVPKLEKRIQDLERLAEVENIALDEARKVIEPYSHGCGPLLDEHQRAAAAWLLKYPVSPALDMASEK